MEPDQDIRPRALMDQLDEIDRRVLEVTTLPLTRVQRIIRLGLFGVLLVLLGLFVPTREELSIGLALSAWGLVIGFVAFEPLLRRLQRRKLERERDRILALYDELDRRLAPGRDIIRPFTVPGGRDETHDSDPDPAGPAPPLPGGRTEDSPR